MSNPTCCVLRSARVPLALFSVSLCAQSFVRAGPPHPKEGVKAHLASQLVLPTSSRVVMSDAPEAVLSPPWRLHAHSRLRNPEG